MGTYIIREVESLLCNLWRRRHMDQAAKYDDLLSEQAEAFYHQWINPFHYLSPAHYVKAQTPTRRIACIQALMALQDAAYQRGKKAGESPKD